MKKTPLEIEKGEAVAVERKMKMFLKRNGVPMVEDTEIEFSS